MDERAGIRRLPDSLWMVSTPGYTGCLGYVYETREEAMEWKLPHEVVIELRLADSAKESP